MTDSFGVNAVAVEVGSKPWGVHICEENKL
jgi:hypothetical protein